MVPAFDLRIGNWITVSEVIYCVTGVSKTKVQFQGHKGAFKQEDLNPIPITQEILERAGFTKRKKSDLYDKIPK